MQTARLLGLRCAVLALTAACSTPAPPHAVQPSVGAPLATNAEAFKPLAGAWPEASARFHTSGAWLGGDGAYSIPLDPLHVLWLFADTFIDPLADGTRENGPNQFIRNSVAIQSGSDPDSARDLSRSELRFSWGPEHNHAATSFFPDAEGGARWFWPLHGVRLPDGRLLLFRMQVVKTTDGFGFRVDDWDAVAIDDPLQPPSAWRPRVIARSSSGATHSFGKLLGSSVMLHDGYLYAYAVENQAANHAIFLARWQVAELAGLTAHVLDDPEWYTTAGFVRTRELPPTAAPAPLFADGQVELSVHRDQTTGRFVSIQMQGLFVSDAKTRVALRTASRPEGPWSALTPFYRPSESQLGDVGNLAAYAAKAHPEQRGADLLVTYVVNDVKKFPPSDAVYYPKALRVHYGGAATSGEP
jgi:hypothetical protein